MFKAYHKIVLVLLVFGCSQSYGQPTKWYGENMGFRSYEKPAFFTSKNTSVYDRDSINLKVQSVADVQQIMDSGLGDHVLAVQIDNASRTDLSAIFSLLNKFPGLIRLGISDQPYPPSDAKAYQLPATISTLKNLIEVQFTYTHKLDMADALSKLLSLKKLLRLSIAGTDGQLPASIASFKNLKRIQLSPQNIGTNNLSTVNWETVDITSGALQQIVIDAKPPKPLAGDTGLLSLAKVKSLKHLDIYLPYLASPAVLSKFTQLSSLNVSGSRTQTSDVITAIKELKNLQDLNLEVSIKRDALFINELSSLSGLKKLSIYARGGLHGTAIGGLEILANFKKIESLRLSCDISTLPDVFNDLPNLKKVNLAGNNLSYLPDGLFNLPALESLDLSRNKLIELPKAEKYNCDRLKTLNLENNDLTSLPDAITKLPKLKAINLSANNLISAANGWENLHQLQFVNFSQNQIQQFPGGLQKNQSVEKIYLVDNKVSTIPDIPEGKYKLQLLLMDNNLMQTVPEHINRYTEMHSLSFGRNKLRSLPSSPSTYENLTEINLNESIVVPLALPACLKSAKKLRTLNLAGNWLLDKKSVFEVILSLPRESFSVDFSHSGVTELPATLQWQKVHFRELNLGNNLLTSLPVEFASTKNDLGTIILRENKFKGEKTLTDRPFSNKAGLKIFFEATGLPLPQNYTVSDTEYAAALIPYIHDFFFEQKWDKVISYARKAIKADSVTYAQKVSFNMIGIALIHLKDYREGIRNLQQYLIDLNNHKPSAIVTLDDPNECIANAYLALNQPNEAAKIYATIGGIDNVIKVMKICKETGNTTLTQQAINNSVNQLDMEMSYFNKDRYHPDLLTFYRRGSYPSGLLIGYSSLLLVANRPLKIKELLNKKIESPDSTYIPVRDLLIATADYLANPASVNKIKSDLTGVIAQHGKINYRWFSTFDQWLPYSNFTAQQQADLMELEKIAR